MAAQRRRARIDVSDGFSISIKVDPACCSDHIPPHRGASIRWLFSLLDSSSVQIEFSVATPVGSWGLESKASEIGQRRSNFKLRHCPVLVLPPPARKIFNGIVWLRAIGLRWLLKF